MAAQILLLILLTVALIPALALLAFIVAPRPLLSRADSAVRRALRVEEHNAASPYARPGFRPVHEELDNVALEAVGTLPPELEGVYLRNGTNTQFAHSDSRMHMFNGAGMLHRIQIRGGRASYSNCYVRTPRFEAERALGRESFMEFGDVAGGGRAALAKMLVERLKVRAGLIPRIERLLSASATTSIQYHHGRLYCLQETGLPFALDAALSDGWLRMDGSGRFEDFGGALRGPFSAHPKIDPDTGDWHAFNLDLPSAELVYTVLSAGRLVANGTLLREKPAAGFVHDAFLTAAHAIFPDVSLRFDPRGLFGSQKSPFCFDPARRLRFGVVPRGGSAAPVRWFETGAAGHIWHTVNAWEERRADGGTDIVLIVPVFRDYPPTVPIHTPLEPHAEMRLFRLDLERGEVSEERALIEGFYERPSINPHWLGRRNRYAYLLDEGAAGGEMGRGVLKYDIERDARAGYFDYGDYVGGEALFVPVEGAVDEDHGFLIDLLMSENDAYLVIIDARTMDERARLPLPQRVPYGVHGCWLGPGQLASLGN